MRAQQYRAANRFGLGAAAQDAQHMGGDPGGWLLDQVAPQKTDPGFNVPASHQSIAEYTSAVAQRRAAQRDAGGDTDKIAHLETANRRFRRQVRGTTMAQTLGRFEYAVDTPTPFRERLVHFWSNHFAVSRRGKPQIVGSCLAYENEAIRTGMDGHFGEVLVRVVAHPVMLHYLDNVQSIGPDSRIGRRRKRGLNENLAREILELHTVGVHGGYSQDDVTALANMLTGWTVGNSRLQRFGAEPGKFVFVEPMHQPGRFRLLGKTYAADGAQQAQRALTDLAVHPATADFLASKLARHFIADVPPASAVKRIAKVFRKTDGHLPSVHVALVKERAAWQPDNVKFKSPYEYLVSVYRSLGVTERRAPRLVQTLTTMNHLPFNAPSPQGWPDSVAHWGSPAALKQRVEWAVAFGNAIAARLPVRRLAEGLVPTEATGLRSALRGAESPGQALGMMLASPTFQWR